MTKIFQEFDLDLEWITDLYNQTLNREKVSKFPKAGMELQQRLLDKGYAVLESDGSFQGLPKKLIVGGEIGGMSPKHHFYEIAI